MSKEWRIRRWSRGLTTRGLTEIKRATAECACSDAATSMNMPQTGAAVRRRQDHTRNTDTARETTSACSASATADALNCSTIPAFCCVMPSR